MTGKITWTPERITTAARIFAETLERTKRVDAAAHAVSAAIGVSAAAIKVRLYTVGPSFARRAPDAGPIDDRPSTGALRLSEEQIRDRDARYEAGQRRNYTQEFFGDPPPGYSALDRQRGVR